MPELGKVFDVTGNEYKTIRIGNFIWMTENLRTSQYNDGSLIAHVTLNTIWKNSTSGAFTYYDNDSNNNEDLGKLYNWFAVNSGKLCPDGWFVPNESHWNLLKDFLGVNVGGKLKKRTSLFWLSPNMGANNESGFSAIGSGSRMNTGEFIGFKSSANFWSSSDLGGNLGGNMSLNHLTDGMGLGSTAKQKWAFRKMFETGSLNLNQSRTYPLSFFCNPLMTTFPVPEGRQG